MRLITKVSLLLVLSVVSLHALHAQSVLDPNDPIINYQSSDPPVQPDYGQIGKWVRTPLLGWNTSSWKCYIYKGVAFRLKFPKTYNPTATDGKRYPMMIFFHGLGEAGPITDNEFQLYHGAQTFTNAVDNGSFDGYVLFMQSQGYWGGGHYDYAKEIIDYMTANNKLDPFQVSVNGLSAGGQACWEMMDKYPSSVTSALPMAWLSYFYGDATWVNKLKYTPIWYFQGGLDGAPAPGTAEGVRDAFLAGGANFRYTVYPELGHAVWDRAWSEPDFFPYQLRQYSSNPWALFGRTEFCPGDAINTTLGIAAGFNAYEWRKDGIVVQSGPLNTLQVTQTGTYDVRVLKGSLWSEWSRKPVIIKIKGPTVTPNITVSGQASRVLPALDGSTSVKLEVPTGFATYEWQKVGNTTVLSTDRFLTATETGQYKVKVTEQFGCSSDFSSPFSVVDANGPNKPDPAINLLATTLSKTSIRLDWSDNPSPQYNETNFEVYQATQSGGPYTFAGITGADIRTISITGLNPSTNYFFLVRAVNNTGAAAPSNEAKGTTQLDTQAPTAPGNLTITSTTRTSLNLSWTASTDDVGVTLYEIYVNGVKTYATTSTTFLVSGLQTPNSYNIVVKARDFAGNVSPASNQVTGQPLLRGLDYKYYVLTTALDSLPDFSALVPAKTGTVANVTLIPRTVDINFGFLWEGYINIPVSGNYVFRTNSDDGSRLYLGALNGQGSPYGYKAIPLVNNDGNHGPIDANSSVVALTQGTYPIAVAYYQGVGGFNINLYWNTPQTGGNFQAIPNSAFSDQPVVNGASPAKPSNLTASAVSFRQINLSWTDNSNNETGFEIWRSTNPLSDFITVGTAPAHTGGSAVTYMDSTLKPNTKYYYRVRAINQYGESDFDKNGQGVDYSYYELDGLGQLPNFNPLTPKKTGRVNNFILGMQDREDQFQLKFTTTINIPVSQIYTFYLATDDGSKLYLDGTNNNNLVVDNDYTHGVIEKSGSKFLSAGSHTIMVTYFESVAGQALEVRMSGSGLPKQLIPDAFLGTPLTNATTLPPPVSPAKPTNLVATALSKSKIQVTWTDNATNETKFELYRSGINNSNYILYQTLPANTTSYIDSGMFANAVFYYKVRAIGSINSSAYTNEDSAKTWNTPPVITQIPVNRTARVGIATAWTINATDADGDALSFTAQNLPAFASLVDNGNKTATLTINPSSPGVFNSIRINVADPNGGSDFTQFNLTVNNNYDPVVGALADQTMDENGQLNLPLTASDQNAGDVLTWSVISPMNAFTITPGSNGTATLVLNPGYGASGVYEVQVQVSDGVGGYDTESFTLTVNDRNSNVNIYVRIRHDAFNTIGAPWNTVTSNSTIDLVDDKGAQTQVDLSFPNGYNTGNSGAVTGNNTGVYPDAVLRDYYVFGAPWMNQTANAVLSGLDPSRKYSLRILGSSNWDIAPNNGSTNYTVNGVTKSIAVQNNTQTTVSFDNLSPDGSGNLTVAMSKGDGASAGYLNALVLTSLFDDGTVPVAPQSLEAKNDPTQGVQLTWKNLAYNETGYQIHRATNPAGPFTEVGLAQGADVASYLDKTVSGNTLYYYKIRAVSVNGLFSAFSDVVSITTINRIPQVTAIASVSLRNDQTLSVPVTATDDPTDQITFKVSGLPQFASFTDNGNGTGTIQISPLMSSVGLYKDVTITATDNSGASSSTSFDITVLDKDMRTVYLNLTDGSQTAGKPWNNLGGWPSAGANFNRLKDDRDSTWASLNITYQDGFAGVGSIGVRPNNGKEIFPATVVRTGAYEQSSNVKRILVSGLDNNRRYNFTFFNSHEDGLNGTTNFTINGVTVSLDAAFNSHKLVHINGVAPTSGQITIQVSKATGADFAYLNAIVMQAYFPTQTPFVPPTDLRVISATRKSITLQWQDRSNNELNFEIYRAASGGSYTKVGTVAANTTSFTDSDVALTPNTPYNYIVRATKNTSPLQSNYSNVAIGYTYAYSVYINFSNNLQAAQPWNNTAVVPQQGFVWNNFRDENNAVTSIGMIETGKWAGMYTVGMNTGNNSGIFPDNVMRESYALFAGQNGSVKIKGLNLTMTYDFTFFGSAQHTGDVNAIYKVNGKAVMLNAAINKSATVTMYGIVPDANGEVLVEVLPGTPTSQYGLLTALIVHGYKPVNVLTPAPSSRMATTVAAPEKKPEGIMEKISVTAYPNPFRQFFTLTVTTETPESLDVMVYDLGGKLVYRSRFGQLNSGINTIRVQPDRNLVPGVYIVRAVLGGRRLEQQVKLIKQ